MNTRGTRGETWSTKNKELLLGEADHHRGLPKIQNGGHSFVGGPGGRGNVQARPPEFLGRLIGLVNTRGTRGETWSTKNKELLQGEADHHRGLPTIQNTTTAGALAAVGTALNRCGI